MPVSEGAHSFGVVLQRLAAQLALAEKNLGVIELIVVDDASGDDSAAVIREHLGYFGKTRLIRLPWKCGTGTAVRVGVAAATGSVIAFTQPGEELTAGQLTTMVGLLEHSDVVVSSPIPHHVGSRAHPSRVSWPARLVTSGYERMTRRLAATHVFTGKRHLAALRSDIAKPLFTILQSPDLAFDAEARVLAGSMRLRLAALPAPGVSGARTRSPRTSNLVAMAAELLRARGHRSRALKAANGASPALRQPTPAVGVPDVIDLTVSAPARAPQVSRAEV